MLHPSKNHQIETWQCSTIFEIPRRQKYICWLFKTWIKWFEAVPQKTQNWSERSNHRERHTQIKKHKSKIYLPPAFFKQYGSSDHVKEIHSFLDYFDDTKSDAAESKAVQLQHITLGWCLTATCERSGVFENVEGTQNRMSTSRIRFSFTTELVSLAEDSLDNIAYCFGFWIISIMITTSKENTVILKNAISHRQKRILQFFFLHWKLLLKWGKIKCPVIKN